MPGAVPPGRAGRLWLLGRLDVARRAADLLDRKERLLRSEEARLHQLAARTAEAWQTASTEARTWTARALLVGRLAEIRISVPPAEAELVWQNTMGVSYPSDATCRQPTVPPPLSPNPALGFAVAANRRAVVAAVEHAAATYAHAQVASELSATRRRRRAIAEHWIPELEAALARLENRLDELEREEHVRIRWAMRQATGGLR